MKRLPTLRNISLAGAALIATQCVTNWQAAGQLAHQPVVIGNVASKTGAGTWNWTAYIAGPPEEIANVQCVVYTLHPTFPNPVQRVCTTSDPKYPFGLSATGWGTFNLLARIEFKDGSVQEIVQPLSFNNPPL